MENERNNVNREYKDRLFKLVFRENLNRKMPLREAIDRAVDECIKEGILEKILRENREEVCSVLLSEYDEQAHIESEKEIAREEGREEGREEVNTLYQKLKEDNRVEDLLRAVDDAGYRNQLLKEYGL